MCGVCQMRDYAASRWRRANVVAMAFVAFSTLALPGDRVEAGPLGGCKVIAAQIGGLAGTAAPVQAG